MPLSSIKAELIEAGKYLMEVGHEQADCIAKLTDCTELVEWLKENVESMCW